MKSSEPTIDEDYLPNNRNKVRSPKKGKFYCRSCDMALVWEGQKCPVCGNIAKRSRNKK
jgi:rubrerythrin